MHVVLLGTFCVFLFQLFLSFIKQSSSFLFGHDASLLWY